jgi:hypothetical protein
MTKTPWDFSSAPEPGETTVPNRPSPEGAALGEQMARLCDVEKEKQAERFPDQLPRCDECAFRLGTLPNGCAETQMDALKCVLERVPFFCHKGLKDGDEPKQLCRGWVILASNSVEPIDRMRRAKGLPDGRACPECHRQDGQHNSLCPMKDAPIDMRKVEMLVKARGVGLSGFGCAPGATEAPDGGT